MTTDTASREWLATVDVRDLNSVRWGPLRQLFPSFVEEIELGRYLRTLLRTQNCKAVQIEPGESNHVFHIYTLADS